MILCCGEALIDMLPRESTGGEPAFAPYPGGAVFNTAIALGRLGVETSFFSGLSRDLFGEMLETALGASHVDASVAVRSDRPTTLAFVKLVDGQARYAFYDENTAGRMLTPADLPADERARLADFIQYFERITRRMLAGGVTADVTVKLDRNRVPGPISA